jgi:hypothetical protein
MGELRIISSLYILKSENIIKAEDIVNALTQIIELRVSLRILKDFLTMEARANVYSTS